MTSLCLRIREIFLLRSEKEERNWKMKAFIRPFFFSFDIFFAAFSSFLSSFSCDSLVPEVCGAPNKYLVVSLPRLNGENLDKEKRGNGNGVRSDGPDIPEAQNVKAAADRNSSGYSEYVKRVRSSSIPSARQTGISLASHTLSLLGNKESQE